MSMIGHNQGPTMEGGTAWRTHCWRKARADLLPTLPVEIVRVRVNRARELGLAYKTYATVRATTGQDIVGFLFSSNALRLVRSASELPEPRRAKLAGQRGIRRILAVHRPLMPEELRLELDRLHGLPFEGGVPAPLFTDSWASVRQQMQRALGDHDLPRKGVLVVGDTAMEREWVTAGRMAGFLDSDRFFA